jgi:hypothetical protein
MSVSQLFDVAFCPLNEAHIPFYGSGELGIAYDPDVLSELSRRLRLNYQAEEDPNTEMCFLHSAGLRPEFRLSFNLGDLADFINATLRDQGCSEGAAELMSKKMTIAYPQDADIFWKLVAAGEALR